jgi:antirestriction protein ArdC
MKQDIYQTVTDKIVDAIESGSGEWQKPWTPGPGGLPVNATTGRHYRGVNVLLLTISKPASDLPPAWASYKQWAAAGCQVRGGEKGTAIVFAGAWTPKNDAVENDEQKASKFLRHSHVFHCSQVDGYEAPETVVRPLVERIADADAFVAATGAVIQYGGGRACYSPDLDIIQCPTFESFDATAKSTATENAYSTILHEITHWSGHKSRCDRSLTSRFGDQAYAAEELIAELGSAFLCASIGITQEPRPDHAQYLSHWLRILKNDKKAIFTAAARASDAAEYLHELTEPSQQAKAA